MIIELYRIIEKETGTKLCSLLNRLDFVDRMKFTVHKINERVTKQKVCRKVNNEI